MRYEMPFILHLVSCILDVYQAGIYHLLQAHEDTQLGMVPSQAALEIDGIGLPDGAVGGQLHGAALDKSTGCHDDLAVVAGHIAGDGGGEGVHGSGRLDALAEGNHTGFAAQLNSLDDVMAAFRGIGNTFKAQGLIEVRGEDGTFFGAGGNGGGQEEALVQLTHEAEVGTHFLAQAGGGEPVGAAVDAGFGAGDVAAGGGKAAAGIFDQGAYDHIRADIGGFDGFHELTVAVVNHDNDIGLDGLAEGDELADLGDGEGGAGGIALGTLDGDHLGSGIDGLFDILVVEAAVREQVDLVVADTVLGQGAGGGADADDLLEGVIGQADRGKQLVPGEKIGA